MTMQPASERGICVKVRGRAREVGENHLGDILGSMAVSIDQPEGGGINKVDVTRHQLAEGRIRVGFNKGIEKF